MTTFMSVNLYSSIEPSLAPFWCAAVAYASIYVHQSHDNDGVNKGPAMFVENVLECFQENKQDETLFNDSSTLSLDAALSTRGGSCSAHHALQQHDHHHPLAFVENLPSNLHHHHHHHHHHLNPLHQGMMESSTTFLPPEDAEKLRQALHVEEENHVSKQQVTTHNNNERRRFQWFRLRRQQRETIQTEIRIRSPTASNTTTTTTITQPVPLRFLRAAKGNVILAKERYLNTLQWRQEHHMDTILSEPHLYFDFIKQHYPHYFHLRGRHNEPVYYEMPPKTNLTALRQGGVTLEMLLRHYAMVTEFMWQVVERDDLQQSIYVIDLQGIRLRDFCGECVDFVRRACAFCNQHYPERSGCIIVINVPSYFKLIWRVVQKFADQKTLAKVKILRGSDEILETLVEWIPPEHIPPEYGGMSMPLGKAPEEELLWNWMRHNNHVALYGTNECGGKEGNCPYCSFEVARNY